MDNNSDHCGLQIKRLDRLIRTLANANLENCGITGEQCHVISYVDRMSREGKSVYQKDFESEFGVKRSSVTSILSNIEKRGYIVRTGDDSDARIKKIELTDEGRKLAEHLHGYIGRLETEIVRDMSDSEKSKFKELLRRAIVNIESSELITETGIDIIDVN